MAESLARDSKLFDATGSERENAPMLARFHFVILNYQTQALAGLLAAYRPESRAGAGVLFRFPIIIEHFVTV